MISYIGKGGYVGLRWWTIKCYFGRLKVMELWLPWPEWSATFRDFSWFWHGFKLQ